LFGVVAIPTMIVTTSVSASKPTSKLLRAIAAGVFFVVVLILADQSRQVGGGLAYRCLLERGYSHEAASANSRSIGVDAALLAILVPWLLVPRTGRELVLLPG